jgi:hypothetical protein
MPAVFGGRPFKRTANRHDYALPPFGETLLDRMTAAGRGVVAIGKIQDLFAGRGIGKGFHTTSDEDGMDRLVEQMGGPPTTGIGFGTGESISVAVQQGVVPLDEFSHFGSAMIHESRALFDRIRSADSRFYSPHSGESGKIWGPDPRDSAPGVRPIVSRNTPK